MKNKGEQHTEKLACGNGNIFFHQVLLYDTHAQHLAVATVQPLVLAESLTHQHQVL